MVLFVPYKYTNEFGTSRNFYSYICNMTNQEHDRITEALGWVFDPVTGEYSAKPVPRSGSTRAHPWHFPHTDRWLQDLRDVPLEEVPLRMASGYDSFPGYGLSGIASRDLAVPYLSKRLELGI